MPVKTFLDNAHYGKNNWWRYVLTSLISWLGPLILIIVISIPFIIFPHLWKGGINAQGVVKNINPLILFLFFGGYYFLSFLIFYGCIRFIHKKKLIILITTAFKVKWMKILKGAGLWFVLMGLALLIEVLIYPSSLKFSFNPSFFILLVLSIIIYSIQASFEEIFFRGYLMQGLGLLTSKPVIPLLITSAIFAVGHFFNGSDTPTGIGVVINMFIFAMTLGIITIGEKSLETAMGVHIANNIFLTTIINSTGLWEGLPSLFSIGTESAMIIPSFILFPILLFIVFRNNWDKLESLFKKRSERDGIYRQNHLLCANCKAENPGIAVFCSQCGEKISLNYASTFIKIVAFLIDIIFLLFLWVFLLIGIVSVHLVGNQEISNAEMLAGVWIALCIILSFTYFIIFEKYGQTIGAKIMNIRVVNDRDHKQISFRQSILRNLLLIVDLIPYPLPGLLAIIFSSKSPKKQRIGDLVAGTLVVQKK
ncbi:MAG: RDD family protein [Methanobacteriaceae archaeon]|nr:RDD family protein [Methanobacteriaceae archaeon]